MYGHVNKTASDSILSKISFTKPKAGLINGRSLAINSAASLAFLGKKGIKDKMIGSPFKTEVRPRKGGLIFGFLLSVLGTIALFALQSNMIDLSRYNAIGYVGSLTLIFIGLLKIYSWGNASHEIKM